MTIESLMLVPLRLTEEHGRLLGDIRSAAARALKADAGDRSDVVRFEALCVQLEKAAERHATETGEFHELDAETTTRVASHVGPAVAVGQDAPTYGESLLSALRGSAASRAEAWLQEGRVVVAVSDPLRTGVAANEAPGESPPPVARWQAADGSQGKKAVIQRFRAQLVEATRRVESDRPVSFNPSGINNQVITEVLREFVRGSPEETVRVGVEYRDGSQASQPFPLRSCSWRTPLRHVPTSSCDWLCCRFATPRWTQSLTAPGYGTPRFRSPEQLHSQTTSCSTQADVSFAN